jgi:Cu2+-exporting ATPase
VATDTAQIVFMEDNLWKLCEFIDISNNLDRNVKASWKIILVPNLLCIAGAFFLGFGVMASVLANNVAAIAALANGLTPRRMYGDGDSRLARPNRPNLLQRVASMAVKYLFRRRTSSEVVRGSEEIDQLLQLMPAEKGFGRTATFFLWAGVAGVMLPGIPGWPLLIVSIALLSAKKPGGSALDRWITRRFPTARGQALQFAYSLMRDLQLRFPDAARALASASEEDSRGVQVA